MQVPHGSGRLFAAVKGLVDAGVDVHVSDEVLPDAERIGGTHIKEGLAKDIVDWW